MSRAADLPNDVESLQRLVLGLQTDLAAYQQALQSERVEIERLKLLLAKLRRLKFGRKSEQLDEQIAQLELTLEDLETQQATIVSPVLNVPVASTPAQKPVRRALPASLPREEIVHEPHHAANGACPDCGSAMNRLGEDVAELIERIPSRFKVVRHIRPKLCCPGCQKIVQAPAPPRPIARGLAGPGFLSQVMVSKFSDHLPLYRQSQIYAREGVCIERSTLADWVGGRCQLLEPLVNVIAQHVLSAQKLHADDTPVPVLSPGKGTTKTARLWVYVRDDRAAADDTPPAVLFRYTPDRKAIHPQRHLASFNGILQADGYAGFGALYERTQNPLTEAA